MTQERSKAVRETENPFGEEDEDEGRQTSPSGHAGESSKAPYGKPASTVNSFSHTKSSSASGSTSFFGSSKDKNKSKDKKGKKKPFVLEAEKENMKSDIAEASISTTNLNNALQTINREKERISDNALAVQRFEECKKLRRKILRYVSVRSLQTGPQTLTAGPSRSTTSNLSSGSAASSTPTTTSCSPS